MSTALALAALAALGLPAAALAHVANVEYRFPLPVWLYGLAGAVVVVASAPAAAWALRSDPRVGSRNLYPVLARFFPGAFLRALAMTLLAVAVVAGFFAPTLGVENPAVLLFWVDFWVGLGIVSALVGNIWDFVNPLANLGRSLDGLLARRGTPQRHYPEALGIWPAVVLLLALSWAELVWRDSRDPQYLAAVILGYCALQLLGVARYGSEIWLARGELFTVFARALARLAPFELYVRGAVEPCRARRCGFEAERIGCPTCFADAGRAERGVRLRSFGAGIHREPALGAGGGAFVVALLATVVFDGLRSTIQYARLEADLVSLLPRLDDLRQTRATFMMILILGAFAVLYLLATALVSLREEGTPFEVCASLRTDADPDCGRLLHRSLRAVSALHRPADPARRLRPDRLGLDQGVPPLERRPRECSVGLPGRRHRLGSHRLRARGSQGGEAVAPDRQGGARRTTPAAGVDGALHLYRPVGARAGSQREVGIPLDRHARLRCGG